MVVNLSVHSQHNGLVSVEKGLQLLRSEHEFGRCNENVNLGARLGVDDGQALMGNSSGTTVNRSAETRRRRKRLICSDLV